MNEFYKKIDKDKIKIKWNKKPIKMDLFLSFLTVKVKRKVDFTGSSTGWTQLEGENNLIIRGGMKTTWSNIATGTAKRKKFHVPKLTKHTSRHTRISIICSWCDSVMSPEKWALINKGINCTCGALLTDQGNAYKEEG